MVRLFADTYALIELLKGIPTMRAIPTWNWSPQNLTFLSWHTLFSGIIQKKDVLAALAYAARVIAGEEITAYA